MENSDDIEITRLIARASEGDPFAWNEIIKMFSSRLIAYCSPRCWGNANPEDALQDTWLAAFRNSEKLRGMTAEKLMPWLIRIAQRKSIDEGRRAKKHLKASNETTDLETPQTDGSSDMLQRLMQTEEAQVLKGCMQEVGPEFREAILLRLQGLSYREIGESLDIPPGTVDSRLSRGTKALKSCVERKLS